METPDEFELALQEQSEQGSENWLDIRLGRFTSSQNFRLMKPGQRLMTDEELKARPKSGPGSKSKWIDDPNVLSDDTVTYIRQKVAEILTGEPISAPWSHAIAWGDSWEPFAAEHYQKVYKCELEPAGFKPLGDHLGGSIDRKFVGLNEFLEIKCPHNPANQIGYLMLTDQFDLKRENPQYYWQCMSNIFFGSFDRCWFSTFDPRMKDDKHKITRIEIVPISSEIDLLKIKCEMAVKEKLLLLKSLE